MVFVVSEFRRSLYCFSFGIDKWVASGYGPCFAGWSKQNCLNPAVVYLVGPELDGGGLKEIVVWCLFVGEVNGDG